MVVVSMNSCALGMSPGGRAQLRATCLGRSQRRSQQGIRPRRRGRWSEVPARSPSASTRSGPVISCPVSGTYEQDQFTVEPGDRSQDGELFREPLEQMGSLLLRSQLASVVRGWPDPWPTTQIQPQQQPA